MKKAIEIITEGQKELERLGLKTVFTVSNPQTQKSIDKIEKKFKLELPEDYKEFIINHGLLSVHLGGASEAGQQMIELAEVIELIADLRMDLIDADIPRTVARNFYPFQYIMDDRSMELYGFKLNTDTKEFYVHDLTEEWENLQDENYIYANNFTEHIDKLIKETIQSAKQYEAKNA